MADRDGGTFSNAASAGVVMGGEIEEFTGKGLAVLQLAIKDEVYMVVHQAESQDDDTAPQCKAGKPVHGGLEVGFRLEKEEGVVAVG